jgi:integrase
MSSALFFSGNSDVFHGTEPQPQSMTCEDGIRGARGKHCVSTGTLGTKIKPTPKTDAEGQGRVAYLSRATVRWLKVWLAHAQITEGAVFRRLVGKNQIGGALNPGSIAAIFKRVAQWIGMPGRFVAQVSGHSTRVGATQDLAALDIDLAAITQAGGWKSPRMPLQYAEKINAARSGMARAAAATGRNEPVSE